MSESSNGVLKFPEPKHIIRFHRPDGTVVGVFDFDKSPATFTGDVDASARLFVECVIRMWGEPK